MTLAERIAALDARHKSDPEKQAIIAAARKGISKEEIRAEFGSAPGDEPVKHQPMTGYYHDIEAFEASCE